MHQAVENRADDERADDADRHVALGILGFLGGRRNRVEADVGEENDSGRPADSTPAEVKPFGPIPG